MMIRVTSVQPVPDFKLQLHFPMESVVALIGPLICICLCIVGSTIRASSRWRGLFMGQLSGQMKSISRLKRCMRALCRSAKWLPEPCLAARVSCCPVCLSI